MHNLQTTIAAIASPMGRGGVGIIRVSGPNALPISLKLLPSLQLNSIKSRYVYFSAVISPKTNSRLDEGCILYFQAPHSYTGEDVVEFQVHSSPFILQAILDCLLFSGAQMASSGEFTRRAFYNGKLTLSQAESVIDLIDASHESAHQVALSHLNGRLYKALMSARETLLSVLEQVEGSIDFPDEVDAIDKVTTIQLLEPILHTFKTIVNQKDYGELVKSGVRVVIVGRPNVGKSSLFNALVGKERSIVTPIAGTTRDYIEADVHLNAHLVRFIDTAGVRDSDDTVEHLGIEKIQNLIQDAHFIFWVLDSSELFTDEDRKVWEFIKEHDYIFPVFNKSDLVQVLSLPTEYHVNRFINVSAKDVESISFMKQNLLEKIQETLTHVDLDLLCNIRQIQCLEAIIESLERFIKGIESSALEDDILALDLKTCILKLGEITGDELSEEVLDGVFSRFCVGK